MRIRSLFCYATLTFATLAVAGGSSKDLIDAAARGDLVAVRARLAEGVDINAKGAHGKTALMNAASNGNAEVVSALLEKGADINASTNDGRTALMFAAEQGRSRAVRALIAKGADVNAKTGDGRRAVDFAMLSMDTETIGLLWGAMHPR